MQTLYKDRKFTVTPATLRTPKQSLALSKIEYVSLRAPYLIMSLPIVIASLGAIFAFGRYLYPAEVVALVGMAVVLPIIGARFGVMKVHSLALREGDAVVYGSLARLQKVRLAVEAAIDAREQAQFPRSEND